MAKSVTYITNLINAIRGKPYIKIVNITKEVTAWRMPAATPPEIVYVKDPHGIIKQDLAKIRAMMQPSRFKKGDTLADVRYRDGQQDLYDNIVSKLLKAKTKRQLAGELNG